MFDFVICDRSPISVQRIMDKKFDEDVDVCEKTAYIEKKAAEEKQQKKLEKIKDEYLKKVKETEDEYLKKCKEVVFYHVTNAGKPKESHAATIERTT